MNDEPQKTGDYWRNRRYMAWTALISMIVFAILAMTMDDFKNADLIDNIISAFKIMVLTYMGGATLVDISAKFKRK